MIDAIAVGIANRFDGSDGSALRAICPRLYRDQAPDKATLPYIVYFDIDSIRGDTLTERVEATRWQFSIFCDGRNAQASDGMRDIYEALITLFDGAELIGDYHVVQVETNRDYRNLEAFDYHDLDDMTYRELENYLANQNSYYFSNFLTRHIATIKQPTIDKILHRTVDFEIMAEET